MASAPRREATRRNKNIPQVARPLFGRTESVFESDMRDFDPTQYGEADRREVNPPIEVESATWSAGGTLDWWVKDRLEWLGRVRGPDGRQRWIKAADLRPAKDGSR
jgi:hypothetical protein